MRMPLAAPWVLVCLLVGEVFGGPALHGPEAHPPLSAVADLGTKLSTLVQREQDARLPLPTIQEIEAIKKVAQILIMLGEQVIPTIIGDQPSPNCDPSPAETPADPVND